MWRGVVIEEGFNAAQFPMAAWRIVKTRECFLESEENRGAFHFHNIEIEDAKLEEVLDWCQMAILPSCIVTWSKIEK